MEPEIDDGHADGRVSVEPFRPRLPPGASHFDPIPVRLLHWIAVEIAGALFEPLHEKWLDRHRVRRLPAQALNASVDRTRQPRMAKVEAHVVDVGRQRQLLNVPEPFTR